MKRKLLSFLIGLLFCTQPFASTTSSTDSGPCLVCYTPYLFETAGIKATKASFIYQGYAQTGQYELEYGPKGFVKGTGTKVLTTELSLTITGLTPNTEYSALLRYKCSSGEESTDIALEFKTTFKIDVGVSGVVAPISKCDLGDNERLKVIVKNYGENPQSLIDLRFSVNEQPIPVPQYVDGFYTGVLSTDSTDHFLFDTGFDYSAEGEYKIASWTELKNDENIKNDTSYYTLFHVPVVNQLPYYQDFEPSQAGWTFNNVTGTTGWKFGTPEGPKIITASSGENCFYASVPTLFSDQVLAYLESPCYDFSNATNDPYLTFNLNYDIDTYYNGIWVEYTTDGGENWKQLGAANDPLNWYNIASNILGYPTWGGNSSGWTLVGHKLTGLKGESNCRVRLVFNTYYNFSGYSGVAVDNITVYNQIDKDLTAVSLVNTSTAECGSAKDNLKFTYLNTGTKSIVGPNQIVAYYQLGNNPVVQENVPSAVILPGGSFTYNFTTPFSSYGPGVYKVKSWVKALNDTNNFNDTTYFTLTIPEPASLPFVENFEKFLFPTGWVGTGYSVTSGHNNKSYVIAGNLFGSFSNFNFTTNSIGPLDGGNMLTFDYRYVEYFDGTLPTPSDEVQLEVEISDDCGETFKNLYTINKTNHVSSVDMKNVSIDLSAYAGKIIKLRYRAVYSVGDYWVDIDNININGCPVNFGISEKIKNVSNGGTADGSITVSPTKGTGPYTYIWSNAATTSTISALNTGNYCVTITDKIGCSDTECFTVGSCPATLGVSGAISPISAADKKDGKITLNLPAGNYTFAWSNGATGKAVSFLAKGNYSVTVTNEFGCTQVLDFSVNVVATSEIQELQNFNINPNPTNGYFTLSAAFNKTMDANVEIYSIYGELIYSKKFEKSTQINLPIDLTENPAGFYILKLSANQQSISKKIIKIQ